MKNTKTLGAVVLLVLVGTAIYAVVHNRNDNSAAVTQATHSTVSSGNIDTTSDNTATGDLAQADKDRGAATLTQGPKGNAPSQGTSHVERIRSRQ